MVTLWIQKDLNFLGYNCGAEDGIQGINTTSAIKLFQADFGLVTDGIVGAKTQGKLMYILKKCQEIIGAKVDGLAGDETNRLYYNFNNIKHFQYKDFTCKCGCGSNKIDIRLVKILDMIRDHFNKPLIVTSAVRCKNHNQKSRRRFKFLAY